MLKPHKKVLKLHKDSIKPGNIGNTHYTKNITTLCLNPEVCIKLDYLKGKYGVSRSALMRILVNTLVLDALDKKLEKEENIEQLLPTEN